MPITSMDIAIHVNEELSIRAKVDSVQGLNVELGGEPPGMADLAAFVMGIIQMEYAKREKAHADFFGALDTPDYDGAPPF